MKNQSTNRLAPCMVAALVALAANSAQSQEVVHTEFGSSESGNYVGDMPCSECSNQGSGQGGGIHSDGFHSGGMHGGGGTHGRRRGRGLHGKHVADFTIQERAYGRPDLFYNYYTQGYANRANAQMYLSPVPVPPNVGHTFYTYQPFLPQHMLYPHVDKYHRYYDNGRGMNRTKASYWTSAHARAKNFYWNFLRIPR